MTIEIEPPPATYYSSLDGLRGVAILLVVLLHGGCPLFQGGFVGVDVFFVISGFLITMLLLKEWDRTKTIRLKQFYLRRVLRLIPALILLLLAYLSVNCLLLHEWRKPLLDILVVLFYLSNWARAFGWSHPGALGHTWSLSIEEQFYILWPPILWFLLSRGLKLRQIALILGFGMLLAILHRENMIRGGASIDRIYNGLDTHADGLVLGCLLAVFAFAGVPGKTACTRRAIHFFAALALLVFVRMSILARVDQPFMRYGIPGIALAGACIILECVTSEPGLIKKILAARWLVWTGRISYGLYLWHYLIFRLLEKRNMSWPANLLLGGCAAFVAASLSYYLVERRFLAIKAKLSTT